MPDNASHKPDSTHPRRSPQEASHAHRPDDDDTAPSPLSRRTFLRTAGVAGAGLALGGPGTPTATAAEAANTSEARIRRRRARSGAVDFDAEFDAGGLRSLLHPADPFETDWVAEDRRLGELIVRYRRPEGEWETVETTELVEAGRVDFLVRDSSGGAPWGYQGVYRVERGGSPVLELTVDFDLRTDSIHWTIRAENLSGEPLEIGDIALPLPVTNSYTPDPDQSATARVLKHHLVAGDSSFLFWMRSNSVGPYLTMVPDEDTHLEYWESQEGFRVFVHSAASGGAAREGGTDWRQPNTSLTLAPAGGSDAATRYGFKLRWADDYDGVREVLVEEGLIDVHVVPGMTVPTDLFARFALRTRETIHGIEAEHPGQTELHRVGRNGEYDIWEVRFARLGENNLTVRFGDDRHMLLEWFATEPIETLIHKRARFITDKRFEDPDLWYDGLLAEWNMDNHALLGPDNYDRIQGWRIYAVSCDDPGLSKPAFLASKVAMYPDQEEVAALDYYLENFVWGGLQRSTEETFPYGIYGIPDWKQNRESEDPGRNGRMHIWRIYDYPHIALSYFRMYEVARDQPQIRTALTTDEYLVRAVETAVAKFTIPYEVERWQAYRIGLYNELVIVEMLEELERRGWGDHFDRLRLHWDRKVRAFINDNPNLFQSEYSFDSTGFESTHALAKYAVEHQEHLALERPTNDRSPPVAIEDTMTFMESQMAANLFCRGWVETAYYYLGSDYRGGGGNGYTLSYMSQMGGWSILDYAYHYSRDPMPYLRLGYNSYLSSWALMNTGTPESGYGYWYPGAENDGGAGGGFEPAPFGQTWLQQPHTRGSWYYSCEIDLGFCGGLRGAATVVADDPIFGRFCYGGELQERGSELEIIPRDGVRRRFHAMLDGGRLHVESATDRFAAGEPIRLAGDLSEVRLRLESDNPEAHAARLRLRAGVPGRYQVEGPGGGASTIEVGSERDALVEVMMPAGGGPGEVRIRRVG
jgi:hypothetical protein